MATLFPGQSLGPGESLSSPDELYSLFMQSDGNAVLYYGNGGPPSAVWATHTNGIHTPGEFTMQTDGNLVLYDSSRQPHWASQTSGNPGAFLNVQNDGNLVVYRAGSATETPNNALWEAGSNTPGAISIDEVNYDQYAGPPDGSANDPVLEQSWIAIWITDALQAAGLPLTDGWIKGFRTLCNRESSYMPNAVNTTDGNAVGPIVGNIWMVTLRGAPAASRSAHHRRLPPTTSPARAPVSMTRLRTSRRRANTSATVIRYRWTVLTSPRRYNRQTRTGPRMGTDISGWVPRM